MDVNNVLTQIAAAVVPGSIPISEIFRIPYYHATMKIQIWNNEIYTERPITEERHMQILKQLADTLLVHTLPNVVFVYCTQDGSPDQNRYLFTHAVLTTRYTKNIAAPCFTFYDWNIEGVTDILRYEDTKQSLYNVSIDCMANANAWDQKEDALTFIGALTEQNYRIQNTQFGELRGVKNNIINNLNPSLQTYIKREELSKYKYLLHLNGHNGAYSSRLKYLLMVGSLSFYITGYKDFNAKWYEYWMFCPEIINNVVVTTTPEQCKQAIEYYNDNKEAAYEKANRAYIATHELLKKENVLLYWKLLLETYHSRLDKPPKEQLYFVKFSKN
jgi:hypothetical protein